MSINCLPHQDRAGPHICFIYLFTHIDLITITKNISRKTIDIVRGCCHTWYMDIMKDVIDNKVIDNLSNEQVDMLLEMLKGI